MQDYCTFTLALTGETVSTVNSQAGLSDNRSAPDSGANESADSRRIPHGTAWGEKSVSTNTHPGKHFDIFSRESAEVDVYPLSIFPAVSVDRHTSRSGFESDEWYQLRADYLDKRPMKSKGKAAEETWKELWHRLCQLTEAAPTGRWQILLSALIAANCFRLYGTMDGWSTLKSNLDRDGARELKDFREYSLMSLGGSQYHFYKYWPKSAGKEELGLIKDWGALDRKINGLQLRKRLGDALSDLVSEHNG